MKPSAWVLSWIAAVAAGVGIARWYSVDRIFIPAAAQPAAERPLPATPAPPVQAAAVAVSDG